MDTDSEDYSRENSYNDVDDIEVFMSSPYLGADLYDLWNQVKKKLELTDNNFGLVICPKTREINLFFMGGSFGKLVLLKNEFDIDSILEAIEEEVSIQRDKFLHLEIRYISQEDIFILLIFDIDHPSDISRYVKLDHYSGGKATKSAK